MSPVRAFRRLLRTPTFTVAATLTLALGIAANLSVFAVVDRVLLEPLPFDEPDRLVSLWHTAPGLGFEQVNQSAALDETYRDSPEIFEEVGMWQQRRASLSGGDSPVEIPVLRFSSEMLPILRVDPILGRRFSKDDDHHDAPPTVMLTHDFWRERFGGDPDIVGETLRINGLQHEVLGVLPPEFEFLDEPLEALLPLQVDRSRLFLGMFNYRGVGRLQPGVTLEQANSEVDRLLPVAAERFPGAISVKILEEAQFAAALQPLAQDLIGDISRVLWILLAAVGLVLAIAAVNVANLFLVRAEARRRELSVRRALGAGRFRLVGELLSESVTLALLGALLAVPLSALLLRILQRLEPESLPRLDQIGLTPGSLLYGLGLAAVAGLGLGLLSAGQQLTSESRRALDLREAGRGGATRNRARAALVVVQVAIGLVLLVGSGLLLRSFAELQQVDPGFSHPETLFTFRIGVPHAEVEEAAAVYRLARRIHESLETIPGVESVGATSSLTMDQHESNDALMVEDFPTEPGSLPPVRRYKFVLPGYFETIGNPLLAGRDLTWDDLEQRTPVAVITSDLAQELWGSPSAALGRRIADGVPGTDTAVWKEIVGVVGAIHDDGPTEQTVPTVYWPLIMEQFWGTEEWVQRSIAFALRTERVDDPSLLQEVQRVVWQNQATLPLAFVRTMDDLYRRSMARSEFASVMLLIAAGVALAIGLVGVYGVLAYIVAQRRREFGVRLALGCTTAQLRQLVVRYGMTLTGLGVVLGSLFALGAGRLLSRLLYGISPFDPLTFGVVIAALGALTLLATLVAGRRAARVQPTEALRAE